MRMKKTFFFLVKLYEFLVYLQGGFPGGSGVKALTAMQETQEIQIQSLSWEDRLEEEMATHSIILAGEIPWTEEPGGLQSTEWQRVREDRVI